ncbi:hypothetical protein Taro_024405, partial [Colocasia esculenta]|nr:hypothetical protein [Colocasia esculenta]
LPRRHRPVAERLVPVVVAPSSSPSAPSSSHPVIISSRHRRPLRPYEISGSVNDTVATLVGARYWDDDVMVVVILGIGTNACYTEHTYVIPKL